MLVENKLLIDKNCPMCRIYGNCFEKVGWVDNQTVDSYQMVEKLVFNQVDAERAKSEVALVDLKGGKVTYGVDAFIKIIAQNHQWLGQLLFWRPIHFLLHKLYRFISFNRHVITGPQPITYQRDCTPPVHKVYRWIYIVFAAFITFLVLNQFAILLSNHLGWEHAVGRELGLSFGQIIWQSVALFMLGQKGILNYLGNMSTISLIGALCLLPILIINSFITVPLMLLLLVFAGIVAFMFLLHMKRSKLLGLPTVISYSWVAYRLVFLILLLTIQLW